ncbi:YraN family protein [Thermodesulfitimonas sp.]
MPDARRRHGNAAEALAAAYLKRKGYQILVRNYRCRFGEIDLIALDRGTLVFVEVRAKSSLRFGTPQESLGYKKQQKLREVARYYLANEWRRGSPCRFDVIAVQFDRESGEMKDLEHIENAF